MNSPESARLARVERQVAYLLQHLGIDPEVAAGDAGASTFGAPGELFGTPVPVPVPGPVGFSDPAPGSPASPYPPELLVALQRGRMVEAIKIYRQATGAGLREAKAACEALARAGLP
jgi:hypothetical protein